jgi:hypothetical protein
MGSPSASGPSGGPAGRKTDGTYGTKKDAEQTRLENFQQGTINRTKETVAKKISCFSQLNFYLHSQYMVQMLIQNFLQIKF